MSVPTPILQYNLSDATIKGLLPSGYTPLAYVECTSANRLINTGITSNNNLKFESKWGNLTHGGYLYGDGNIISAYASTSGSYNWRWGTLVPSSPKPTVDSKISYIEQSKNGVKINGVLQSTYSGTPSFSSASSIYLFGSTSSSYYLSGRCYYIKIWNSESLVRDFVPCINSSNVVGLYDLVERQFYSPSSNVLKAGPELAIGKNGEKSLPEEYQQAEYLEGTGTQHIKLNYTVTANDKVEYTISYSKFKNNDYQWFIGNRQGDINWLSGARASNYECFWSSSTSYVTGSALVLNKVITNSVDFSSGTFYYSGGSGTFTTITPSQYGMYVFIGNYSPGASSTTCTLCKCFNLKIYTGTTIKVNLIPCYRKSDGKPGMYDTVNRIFYTNAGSGEFILGPTITNCYTWEPNAGSGTQQGLYVNCNSIYDTSKGWVADFTNNTAHLFTTISAVGNNFSVAWWELSSSFNGESMPWRIYPLNPLYKKCLNTGDGSSNPWYKSGTTAIDNISNNVWHHFVVTGNGSTNYLYVDGVKYGQSKTFKGLTGTSLVINGSQISSTSYCRNPKIFNFQIFNVALTDAQVKELYGK